jgi:simple sugar transport system permease protein
MADDARPSSALTGRVAVIRRVPGTSALGRPGIVAALLAVLAIVVFSWPAWQCAGDPQACFAVGFLAPDSIAAWLEAAARIGIVGAAVCLLMIAGELDLSIGAIVGGAGLVATLAISELGLTPILAALLAFVFALLVGLLNGWIVTRTGLPSLVVTLGTLLVVRGVTSGTATFLADRGLETTAAVPTGDPIVRLFGGTIDLGGIAIGASVVWAVLLAAVAAWLLTRTTFGNWVLGTGGNVGAAREAGVPVRRVKVALFMATAASAAILGLVGAFSERPDLMPDAGLLAGEAIAASAMGGTLLTGGAGSPIGALVGAVALGMTSVGMPLAGFALDWYVAIVGATILVAAIGTPGIRRRMLGPRAA